LKEEPASAGGIVIPDSATEKPIQGEVCAVSKGKILENASAIAGIIVTTEAMVAEEPKEEKAPDVPGDGMCDVKY
jgi:co-chaperonin GroES (HSP10)